MLLPISKLRCHCPVEKPTNNQHKCKVKYQVYPQHDVYYAATTRNASSENLWRKQLTGSNPRQPTGSDPWSFIGDTNSPLLSQEAAYQRLPLATEENKDRLHRSTDRHTEKGYFRGTEDCQERIVRSELSSSRFRRKCAG